MVMFDYFDFDPEPHKSEPEVTARKKSPFDEPTKSFRSNNTNTNFWHTPLSDHMDAMKAGSIGRYLHAFLLESNIKVVVVDDMPLGTEAFYEGQKKGKPGTIKCGEYVNALILGHETRHGWQQMRLPKKLLRPESPAEELVVKRFIEADARAIGFGVALQVAHHMRVDNRYAYNLIACLDDHEKEICAFSLKRMDEICGSPQLLKQAMRQAFDAWIAAAPAQTDYERMTEGGIRERQIPKNIVRRILVPEFRKGHAYTRADISPDFMKRLAEALGYLGFEMGGNYLTETRGPDFNSPFYIRPCNFRVERQIAAQALITPKP